MKNCPQCQSDNIKKASLVQAEGVGAVGGVGVGSGGVGVGIGVSTTMLAAKCAPPRREKSSLVSMAMLLFGLLTVFAVALPNWLGNFVLFVFLPAIVIIPFACLRGSREASKRHKQALEEYEKTYMCLRCGSFYKPFE